MERKAENTPHLSDQKKKKLEGEMVLLLLFA